MSRDIVTVIKSVNYSEADKILTVFGRELGKFTLFAKSMRKINSKNRPAYQRRAIKICWTKKYGRWSKSLQLSDPACHTEK